MNREEFCEAFQCEKDKKPLEEVNDFIKVRGFTSGHFVYKIIMDNWRLPHIVIYYREKILDKYFREAEPPKEV